MDNADEIRFWNRRGGQQWRTHQADFDRLFCNVTERLFAHTALAPGERVMDVGCGNGESTVRAARAVGRAGQVTAVDVSDSLLEAARSRLNESALTEVRVVNADAQVADLDTVADVILSRFGVMFFADPVAAFANLHRHTYASGRLAFAAWGEFSDNPWFALPFDAAVSELGPVPDRDPRKPGPTAFGDPVYVASVLTSAGWHDVKVHTENLMLEVDGNARHAAALASELGPVARVYREHTATDANKARIIDVLETQLSEFETADGTCIPATIHFATASATPPRNPQD